MKRIKYSFVIILVFIIDQISKIVVANNINLNESRVVIKNFLNLTYVKNKIHGNSSFFTNINELKTEKYYYYN